MALLKSQEVADDLERRGKSIGERAGGDPDFVVKVVKNRDRNVCFVTTATIEGKRAEAKDRTLTRAIDAGR